MIGRATLIIYITWLRSTSFELNENENTIFKKGTINKLKIVYYLSIMKFYFRIYKSFVISFKIWDWNFFKQVSPLSGYWWVNQDKPIISFYLKD